MTPIGSILSGRDVLGKDGDTDVSLYYNQCIALYIEKMVLEDSVCLPPPESKGLPRSPRYPVPKVRCLRALRPARQGDIMPASRPPRKGESVVHISYIIYRARTMLYLNTYGRHCLVPPLNSADYRHLAASERS